MKKMSYSAMMAALLAAAAVSAGVPASAAETEISAAPAAVQTEADAAASDTFDKAQAESEIAAAVDLEKLKSAKNENGLKAEDWLPIGSVVLLDGANKTLMVMARFVYNNNDQKYYEYCGCLYPEGFGDSEYYFFNHDEIALTVSRGYEDDYEKLYRSEVLDGLDITSLNEAAEDETEAAEQESETQAQ